jgi:hypothetical protein
MLMTVLKSLSVKCNEWSSLECDKLKQVEGGLLGRNRGERGGEGFVVTREYVR